MSLHDAFRARAAPVPSSLPDSAAAVPTVPQRVAWTRARPRRITTAMRGVPAVVLALASLAACDTGEVGARAGDGGGIRDAAPDRDGPTPPADAAHDSAPPPPVPGFRAEYFASYHDLVVDRVEPSIDHAWGDGGPDAALGVDHFSARFTATLTPPASGTYLFATQNDDGVRLWVGETLVIDDWRGHFPERHEGSIDLVEGEPVAIRLDYFELDITAEVHLYVRPPGSTEAVLGPEHVHASVAPSGIPGPKPPFTNAVVPFDCPDPGILAVTDPASAYYMVCTGGTFPIRRSRDLVRWEDTGAAVLPAGKPSWAANGFRNWAPEIHRVGGRYVAYFTTVNGADVLSIGAAFSEAPLGPYTELDHPLVEHPDGVIDGNYFLDADGRHYLFYKIDGNAHGRPTPIFVRELAPDGLSFAPGSAQVQVLVNDPGTWEGGVVEASWTVLRDGYYYLFYSGNVYDHRYRTGVARATSVTGPYEKHGAPILANDARWVGPGHGSVVAVGDEDWFFYHAWNATASGVHDGARGRFGLLDRIAWEGGWPRIGDGTATEGSQPWPGAE